MWQKRILVTTFSKQLNGQEDKLVPKFESNWIARMLLWWQRLKATKWKQWKYENNFYDQYLSTSILDLLQRSCCGTRNKLCIIAQRERLLGGIRKDAKSTAGCPNLRNEKENKNTNIINKLYRNQIFSALFDARRGNPFSIENINNVEDHELIEGLDLTGWKLGTKYCYWSELTRCMQHESNKTWSA